MGDTFTYKNNEQNEKRMTAYQDLMKKKESDKKAEKV